MNLANIDATNEIIYLDFFVENFSAGRWVPWSMQHERPKGIWVHLS